MTTTAQTLTRPQDCVVHASPCPDFDDRGPWDFEPTPQEVAAELVAHIHGGCDQMCGHCYDEWRIRREGIESINLEDDHAVRQILDACSCGRGLS